VRRRDESSQLTFEYHENTLKKYPKDDPRDGGVHSLVLVSVPIAAQYSTLSHMPLARQISISQGHWEIYAPLAMMGEQLGKTELEDLSLRY